AILPLAPLLQKKLIQADDIIIDSKSGVSGAGRAPKLGALYCECNESMAAYGVGVHRHTPEIAQILSKMGGKSVNPIFTPHLTPMDRGILTTTYSKPTKQMETEAWLDHLRSFYQNEPFVKIVDHLPATKHVAGTNFVHITARAVGDRVITISALDNLVKGASGAAVQNFNIIFGYCETMALL
ncbi:MAG: Asd/ArgC dimerization domain-containing protein, partial [Thermoguttaceae bacterium]